MPSSSALDHLYANLTKRRRVFERGWGRAEDLTAEASGALFLTDPAPPDLTWSPPEPGPGFTTQRGAFPSPAHPERLPPEVRTAHVLLVRPTRPAPGRPLAVHLPATSDEGHQRRLLTLAAPLAAERGVASLIPEAPFYGLRRARDQRGPQLLHVADLLALARGVIDESRALAAWGRDQGFGPLLWSGVSMGGQLAFTAAALDPHPSAVAALIPAHAASAVYLHGLISHTLAWDTLAAQLGGSTQDAREHLERTLGYADVRRFPALPCPRAAAVVAADRDAFVPPWSTQLLAQHYPHAHTRWLPTGHVGAFILHRRALLRASAEALSRLDP